MDIEDVRRMVQSCKGSDYWNICDAAIHNIYFFRMHLKNLFQEHIPPKTSNTRN